MTVSIDRFTGSFIASLLLGLVGALGSIYSFNLSYFEIFVVTAILFFSPYLLLLIFHVKDEDKKLRILDNSLRTCFGDRYNDAIRFRSLFGDLVYKLMELDQFSTMAVEFTNDALDKMAKKGVIKIGCGIGEYIDLVEKGAEICNTSLLMTCRNPPCFFKESDEAHTTLRTIEKAAKEITGDKIRIGILDNETIGNLKKEVEKQEDLCVDWFKNENPSIVTYWGKQEYLEKFAGERDGEKWTDLEDFIIFNETFMVQYILALWYLELQ